MKRSPLPARHRAANKAQENPYGALVVFLLFLAAVLLSSRTANAKSAIINKDTEFGIGRG
jgi:ABC-type microcin C transport system permease subunit YejE